jgi:tRNA G26 N,N-dimethylase Trm1
MTTISKACAQIMIFKTNLRLKKDLKKIYATFSKEPRIKIWNVDTEDIDKVLRIESVNMEVDDIIKIIKQTGYQCEELPD